MFFRLSWLGHGPEKYDFQSIAVANDEKLPLRYGSFDVVGGIMHWVEFDTPHFWDGVDSITAMRRCFETNTRQSNMFPRRDFNIWIGTSSGENATPIETKLLDILEEWDKTLIRAIAELKLGRGRQPDQSKAKVRKMLESIRDELKPTRQTARRRR